MSRKRFDYESSNEDPQRDTPLSDAESVSSGEEERQQNKRRREAARQYLQSLQSSSLAGKLVTTEEEGAEVVDRANIAARLQQDILQAKSKVFQRVAANYRPDVATVTHSLKGKQHSPTSVVFSTDSKYVYAGFKSGEIIKWSVDGGKRIHTFSHDKTGKAGHKGHVLCLAVSGDGKYVVSGGRDHLIHVWSTQDHTLVTTFSSHRGPVFSLVFQLDGTTLYSASADRTVKLWNMEQLAYMDTLFGHQDEVVGIDALAQERCITVGSRDRTARLWKIPEESQLVFRANDDAGGSIETVAMIDGDHFATGSDQGGISLWALNKKKPIHTQSVTAGNDGGAIVCLYSFRLTDLLVSGSEDGIVRLWQIDTDEYKWMQQICAIPVGGCINGISMDEAGTTVAVAVGREHRLGRWNVDRTAKDRVVLLRLDRLNAQE